jgi:repressor LexA
MIGTHRGGKSMEALTQRQEELLQYIKDHILTNGYPPSIREMCDHMGIRSTNGVNDHLKALVRKGYISRAGQLKSRAVVPLKLHSFPAASDDSLSEPDVVSIPLLGRVAAGAPILAEQNLDGTLHLERSLVGHSSQPMFALKVKGDSMIGKGILDGDIVFVKSQQTAGPGQVVEPNWEMKSRSRSTAPKKTPSYSSPPTPRLRLSSFAGINSFPQASWGWLREYIDV